MNINKEATLKNLITEDLSGLNVTDLSDLYAYEQKLLNGNSLLNIHDINTDTLIKNFIDQHQLNSAASTIYNYTIILQDYLNYARGVLDIESLMSYLRSKSWSDNTKRRNYVLLKRFLYYLFTEKYMEIDLSTHIKIPQKVANLCFCPSKEQVGRFIDAIKLTFVEHDEAKKYETMFKLYIKTGCRRNELLNLNVEDIDFDRNTITIKKTKNGDVKIIPMDSNLRQLLLVYLDYFKYKSGPLFRGIQGNRICKQTLMNVFNKIKTKAGLPKEFKIHSFRRFFINELRKNHIDIATIQKLAGHRDIRTTEIYCNVSEEEKIRAIESIRV